jgi:hypothetical protein
VGLVRRRAACPFPLDPLDLLSSYLPKKIS